MEGVGMLRAFDHVGITVSDLDRAVAFFEALGLEVEGRTTVEGAFIDTVCGIPDSCSEIVMLVAAGRRDEGGGVELRASGARTRLAGARWRTSWGCAAWRSRWTTSPAMLDRLAQDGYGLVGGVGEYEGVWRMAYVRGPEGITVALAERLG